MARASVTTDTDMRRYLNPTEDAKGFQLLQDGTSIRAIARRFAVSPSKVPRAWDSRRQAVTQGELDMAVEGPLPISRSCNCSFVQGGTGWTLPEPYKMTSSRPLVWMSLTKQSETDLLRVGLRARRPLEGPVLTAGTVELDWHLPMNTRIEHMWQKWKGLEKPWRKLCCP